MMRKAKTFDDEGDKIINPALMAVAMEAFKKKTSANELNLL
jgi:hypothetical protein